jgi:nucleotidyltransferase/DNA polymerase involved in DNA repair
MSWAGSDLNRGTYTGQAGLVYIEPKNTPKALGIALGAPWHLHPDHLKAAGVVVRSSNYTLYGDMSGRVMDVLSRFTPDLEIYSIDEAFLGMDGFGARLEAEARAAVLQWTGIPVSMGIELCRLASLATRNNDLGAVVREDVPETLRSPLYILHRIVEPRIGAVEDLGAQLLVANLP